MFDPQKMSADYLSILLFIGAATAICLVALLLSRWFGPIGPGQARRKSGKSDVQPVGSKRRRFPLRPYLVVLMFVPFEVAIVILFTWAAIFRKELQDGRLILAEPLTFIGILLIGLIYVWRRGGFEWK